MINKEEYLLNPCGVSSIPYWKTKVIKIPDNLLIIHNDNFNKDIYKDYIDEPYFRIIHNLDNLINPTLPNGYSLCEASLKDYTNHINGCYSDIRVSEKELEEYTNRSVYDSSLWIALKDDMIGKLVATGIAEIDKEINEGVIEWIQVSKEYRNKGLGKYLVLELLTIMKNKVKFVTVSGRCNNKTKPEALYRKCGFTGNDIWHVLKIKK